MIETAMTRWEELRTEQDRHQWRCSRSIVTAQPALGPIGSVLAFSTGWRYWFGLERKKRSGQVALWPLMTFRCLAFTPRAEPGLHFRQRQIALSADPGIPGHFGLESLVTLTPMLRLLTRDFHGRTRTIWADSEDRVGRWLHRLGQFVHEAAALLPGCGVSI